MLPHILKKIIRFFDKHFKTKEVKVEPRPILGMTDEELLEDLSHQRTRKLTGDKYHKDYTETFEGKYDKDLNWIGYDKKTELKARLK